MHIFLVKSFPSITSNYLGHCSPSDYIHYWFLLLYCWCGIVSITTTMLVSWQQQQQQLRFQVHHCLVYIIPQYNTGKVFIPPETKFRGGILDSPCSSVRLSVCPSVRLSVRPSVRPWVGVRMITLILFSGFKKFLVDISLGSWSCLGLNISVLPH